MRTAPVAVVDALNSLIEAEQNSIFRFMAEGSPYLSRATVEIRRAVQAMAQTSYCHCREIHEMIDALGGTPRRAALQPEEQYLAYLSLKFLLPRLARDKELTIRRYENTLRAITKAPADIQAMLERHLAEHRAELDVLEQAGRRVRVAG